MCVRACVTIALCSGFVAPSATSLRSIELDEDEARDLTAQTKKLVCTSEHRTKQFAGVGVVEQLRHAHRLLADANGAPRERACSSKPSWRSLVMSTSSLMEPTSGSSIKTMPLALSPTTK
mgnify:CR=1 FL=1